MGTGHLLLPVLYRTVDSSVLPRWLLRDTPVDGHVSIQVWTCALSGSLSFQRHNLAVMDKSILLTKHASKAIFYLPIDTFHCTSPPSDPSIPSFQKTSKTEKDSLPATCNNLYLHTKPLRLQTGGQMIWFSPWGMSRRHEVSHWHVKLCSGKPRGNSLWRINSNHTGNQQMWAINAAPHHVCSALLCDLAPRLSESIIIPHNQRTAFISDTAPSTDEPFFFSFGREVGRPNLIVTNVLIM